MTLRQAKINVLNELSQIALQKGGNAKKKEAAGYLAVSDNLHNMAVRMQKSEDRMKEKKAAKV